MWIFWPLFSSLAIILNSIESSSQSGFPSGDEADPNLPESSSDRHPPMRSRSPRRLQSSSASSPPADRHLRVRSRSPTQTQIFQNILGFSSKDLRRIRLKPYHNPTQIFELRNYTFPLDTPIRLKIRNRELNPLPTGPQIVLSTSDGDVFAISEKKAGRGMSFRALFQPGLTVARSKRAVMNIFNGEVRELTDAEAVDYPIVNHHAIKRFFDLYLVN